MSVCLCSKYSIYNYNILILYFKLLKYLINKMHFVIFVCHFMYFFHFVIIIIFLYNYVQLYLTNYSIRFTLLILQLKCVSVKYQGPISILYVLEV